jgi:uncharacterized delta-60 repeat protein
MVLKSWPLRVLLSWVVLAVCSAWSISDAAAPGSLLWPQNLNGTSGGFDRAQSVAVDHQGNVVAAGFTENSGTFQDFTVAKFDRDGALLWQRELNGTATNSLDQAFSVVVDNQGNVVAAGETENTGTSRDFTVAKFDRNGTLLWRQDLNGTANGLDQAFSVVVDNKGNVVAVGETENTGTSHDFTVAKFDRNGTLLWRQELNGTANGRDEAFSVAVDHQGNVLTAGLIENTGMSVDFTVAKFGRDGTLLWRQELNGTANGSDVAVSVTVDNQGNALAAGFIENPGTSFDFTVAKFDRDGTLLWRRELAGTASGFDVATSVAVNHQGNVVAAGFTENTGTSVDFTVAKFDRDGTLLWQRDLNGTANGSDVAESLAVDTQGNVVASGRTFHSDTFDDFTVAKFDRDGTLLWQQDLNGPATFGDVAFSVAVATQGSVVAGGQTNNSGTSFDFTVAKFAR